MNHEPETALHKDRAVGVFNSRKRKYRIVRITYVQMQIRKRVPAAKIKDLRYFRKNKTSKIEIYKELKLNQYTNQQRVLNKINKEYQPCSTHE